MKNMFNEFKAFILRGNVLDLAVGVIIGGAFTAIVKSLVNNIINPLIGIFAKNGALAHFDFKLGNATFHYGAFLNDVLNFLITAAVVFVLVKGINFIFQNNQKEEEEPEVSEEVKLLQEIRDELKKK